jgi:predicted  nucleic acid-binding Zn-ribbon protein
VVSFFAIRRVRVTQGNRAAYDQVFHRGVNIIRGENSSGKSTISDFIFYGLGGDYDRWKDAAAQCSAVRLEVETQDSLLTVHRNVSSKQEPLLVFYGGLEDSLSKGIDDWQRVPIRRPPSGKDLSFTQVLFRAAGIPEAPNVDNSNITAHQLLRLLYSDQQTPAGKLFRFESFDTRDIREAVGQLVIGVNGYELYEGQLRLRQLNADYAEKDRLYKAALLTLPQSEGLASIAALDKRLGEITSKRDALLTEIANIDELVATDRSDKFVADRRSMQSKLRRLAAQLHSQERRLADLDDEKEEISQFVNHLESQLGALLAADELSDRLGTIEFQYCPACLKPLKSTDEKVCIVCHEEIDEDKAKAKYLEIKIDTELQIRESQQLLTSKAAEIDSLQAETRALRRAYSAAVNDFSNRYDVSNSPRESFLAERNKLIGGLERELSYVEELRASLDRIDLLSRERAELNDQIDRLSARLRTLEASSTARTRSAMGAVDTIGRRILKRDLPREDTFEDPKSFSISFGDDAMLVDGKMNFAESSNVVLKNTAILSLFLAACYDAQFWHPKFLLMDNIEDKGMEQERSHNYQRLIVEESKKAKFPHQIIFTTSMMDPSLENSGLTVGVKYTRQNKTLTLDAR